MRQRIKRPRIYRKKSQTAAVTQNENAFPGYPHYPQDEDVMSTAKRSDLDMEKFPEHAPAQPVAGNNETETGQPAPKTDGDITKDDMVALGPKDQDMDMGDDEIMSLSGERYDRTGEDLDVPGAELDNENEKTGNEDEENNYYSLGGDKE
jgi:hypothetical protein